MLNGTGIDVRGAAEMVRTLRRAGVDLDDMKPVNLQAANVVEQAAGSAVPRRSGALAATLRTSATKRAGVIRAGNNRTTASAVPYANPIHWGWLRRGIRPNAFLTRTAKQTENRWVGLYETFVETALSKIKGA